MERLDTCVNCGEFSRIAGHGLCKACYSYQYKHGVSRPPEYAARWALRPQTEAERFWSKVDKNGPLSAHRPDLGPCWLWIADKTHDGYGHRTGGDPSYAHCWAYVHSVGPIPDGLKLDHLCRVRHCVNPTHLEPVTNRENLLRGVGFPAVNAAKTHCKRGHLLDEANTIRRERDGSVHRKCRRCTNDNWNRIARAKRQAAVRDWCARLQDGAEVAV